jgi:hypothetical protein
MFGAWWFNGWGFGAWWFGAGGPEAGFPSSYYALYQQAAAPHPRRRVRVPRALPTKRR